MLELAAEHMICVSARGVVTGEAKQETARGAVLEGAPPRTADYVSPQQRPFHENP